MSHQLQHHYGGWRPSLPDIRDHVADPTALPVKPEVDPRADLPPVYDQGQLGSCTANAVAAAVDYDRILNGKKSISPARLAIYWLERKLEHQPADQDTGAFGRDGFKACAKFGYWAESKEPYTDDVGLPRFAQDPVATLGKPDGKLTSPYKVVAQNVTAIKQVLSNRQTVAIGFTVYESFESQQVADTGRMPVPNPSEQILGGHEVLVVGYLKAEPNHVLVRNSWGEGWGLGGYFLMPLAVLLDPRMTSDLRTIWRKAGK